MLLRYHPQPIYIYNTILVIYINPWYQAFSASLRMELKSWDIPVITANPSFHKTPMVEGGANTLIRCWDKLDEDVKAQYGDSYIQSACTAYLELTQGNTWNSMNVTHELARAISAKHPQARYLIGLDARCGHVVLRALPSWLSEGILAKVQFKIPPPAVLKNGQWVVYVPSSSSHVHLPAVAVVCCPGFGFLGCVVLLLC